MKEKKTTFSFSETRLFQSESFLTMCYDISSSTFLCLQLFWVIIIVSSAFNIVGFWMQSKISTWVLPFVNVIIEVD